MMRHVWVVEMLVNGRYEPCQEAKLWKRDAVASAREWRRRNTADRFRIAKYEPAERAQRYEKVVPPGAVPPKPTPPPLRDLREGHMPSRRRARP